MTPTELQAIRERWNDKNICVHPEALKTINSLLAELERMKCCGNCWHWKLSEKLNSMRCGNQQNRSTTRDFKCEKWQGVK